MPNGARDVIAAYLRHITGTAVGLARLLSINIASVGSLPEIDSFSSIVCSAARILPLTSSDPRCFDQSVSSIVAVSKAS
jgi:hypothetical protein